MKRIKNNAGGRPPKLDKVKNRLTVNFTDMEHCDFLTMWEKSGVESKSEFIKARVFGESFRVTTVDKTMMIYEQRLSAFYNQFKAIGVNYNQALATLRANFTEQKTYAMLYKMECATIDLVRISHEIFALSKEFKTLWLQTSGRASR
ncbi:MAG: conjugal transfer protein MobA [Rikenellaceae bacterium]